MIKMLTSTYYDGKQYKQGETYRVDVKTEKRWTKNGLAEAVNSGRVDDSPPASTDKEPARPGRPRKVFENENGGSD